MNSFVLAQEKPRADLTRVAQWLAISFAAAIPLSNALTNLISVLLVLACLACIDRGQWIRVLQHPTTKVVIALVALTLLYCLFSIGERKEIFVAVRKNIRLLYFPLLLPIFIHKETGRNACVAFVVAMFISVVAAIVYTWTFFKDPITTSLFVSFSVFMLLHLSFECKRYKMITIPLMVFFCYYLFFIGTGRAGQLLCIVLCTLFLWQRAHLDKKSLVPLMGVLGMMMVAALFTPSSFIARQTIALQEIHDYLTHDENQISHESSMGIRLTLARNSLELLQLKPFAGFGTGAFKQAYSKHASEYQFHKIPRTNPHNQYLLTWVEQGLPGLILLLMLFGTLLLRFFADKQLEGYLGVGLCIAMIVGCSMNSWLLDFPTTFFFVFFAALFSGAQMSRLTT